MREIKQLNTICTSESQTKGSYNLPFTPALSSRENMNKEDGGAIQKQITSASLSWCLRVPQYL